MCQGLLTTIVLSWVVVLSAYLLITLIINQNRPIEKTSQLRFIFLLIEHVIGLGSIWMFTRFNQLYEHIIWCFANCSIISIMFTACEIMVKGVVSNYNYGFVGKGIVTDEGLELTFINLYYILYAFALVGMFLSGFFISATEALICYQICQINQHLSLCLQNISYNPQQLKQKNCAICLADFLDEDQDLMRIIACNHIFHKDCLMQWIKYNTTCPMDRNKIFNLHQPLEPVDYFGA